MNVDAVLQQKRLRSTKRYFSYDASDEPLSDTLKKLEVTFFNAVVDAATSAIQERFSTLENVIEKFGVLSNFQSLADNELQKE
ncbi:Zinc finger MYMtype protein 1like [Caligus rogercresseyi]|uniref:Zinc finger MYMtype protein 1like n=1 Tax=Caligus rogercresseyi TaxID=217165 RepID=A0A7T8HI71_CALRO|nr:Zinc finger MYMtype protein 1like [Caligus rogercresseyi]